MRFHTDTFINKKKAKNDFSSGWSSMGSSFTYSTMISYSRTPYPSNESNMPSPSHRLTPTLYKIVYAVLQQFA